MTDASGEDLTAWDRVAEKYASQPDVDWFDDFFDRHLGDVAGKRVLDLGCGHGRFADRLVRRGADVDAVDGSAELLDIGRASYPNVSFRQIDLRDGIAGEYAVVIALMVLMDVPELEELRPRIRRDGVLVATLLIPRPSCRTPSMTTWVAIDRFGGTSTRRSGGSSPSVGTAIFHRPISKYVEWIASLRLGAVELFEPPAASYDGRRSRIRPGSAWGPIKG